MTYYFGATGRSKTEAILDCDAKIDKLCKDMEVHEYDKAVISGNMRNVVNALPDPDFTEDVFIALSGYIVWAPDADGKGGKRVTHINCSVSAGLTIRKTT